MILNNRFEEPYSRFAPESSLPLLSKTLVKSRLSNKFWKCTEKIYDDANALKTKPIPNDNGSNSNNNQVQTNDMKQKHSDTESDSDVQTLKKMIVQLQNEITERDAIIDIKNAEIAKLNARVEELESELANIIVST